MLRGLFTAASGMYTAQRKTEMLSNNMANAQTPGFKADEAHVRAFPEMLLSRLDYGSGRARQVGGLHTGVYMQELVPRFAQGDLMQTDRSTDLALIDQADSSSFFTVEQNGQTVYTRNGRLTLDHEGLLTTDSGLPVLDRNGNRIRLASEDFAIDERGQIIENGRPVAQLGIAATDNPGALMKVGDGVFRTENNTPLVLAGDDSFLVNQGAIERSNVDITRSMTEMTTAYRTFEANQKVLQAYDRSLDKAVNEVGRVN